MTRHGVNERSVRRRERALARTGKWGTEKQRRTLKRMADRAERERKRLGLPPPNQERSALWGLDRQTMRPEDQTAAWIAANRETT